MSTVDMKILNNSVDETEERDAFSKLVRRISANDVYWCNLGDVTDGFNKYMIKKVRPCIILSKDSDDMQKNCFTILPIKSYRGDNDNSYFVTKKIDLGDVESLLCLDQIRPINRRSIQQYIGTITPEQRADIDQAICEYLDIKRYKNLETLMYNYGLTIDDVIGLVESCYTPYDDSDNTEEGNRSCTPIQLSEINIR